MRKLISVLILVSVIQVPGAARAFTISNFSTPESMAVDPDDGSYFVSNINGGPTDKDGNGFISKVSPNGNIVIQKFIGGKKDEPLLHAPKGLAIVKKTLFVTDIDAVKCFDKDTGKHVLTIDFSRRAVKFLNDLATDGSDFLYVSDILTNEIFTINLRKNYRVRLFKRGSELGSPNGLMVNPRSKNLMVVTWQSGQILEIDRAGKIHVLKRGLTTLDGIDHDHEGNIYVSSFEKGEIYKIAYFGRGVLNTFLNGLTTPADISCDRKKQELLIPSFKGNTVLTVSLKPDATA